MKIEENIFELMAKKHVTQGVMANALKLDPAVISNIKKGKRALRVNELEIIAKVLNVDILYLFTYPDVYVKREESQSDTIEAVLQIKLLSDKKEQVLKLILGENNLEILNR